MGQSQITEIQVFTGGLHIQPVAHLLAQEEARYLANANVRFRNLTPFPIPLLVRTADDNFAYEFYTEFEFYPIYRSNVFYSGVWYWTDVGSSGKKYRDGTELPLGIAPPIGRPTVAQQAPTEGDGITGNVNYLYTYYDPDSGSESPPSQPSVTLDLLGANAKQAVVVSDIVPSPDGFQTKLYRIGGIITAYTAVVTLENADTTYTDQLHFTEMQGTLLDTFRSFPPPANLQYLTESQGRFYGASNSELMFTPIGKPDSWYLLDFIGFDEVITGIADVANGLLVMISDKTWLISGSNPVNFRKVLLSSSEGCVAHESIATNEGTAIWLSKSGFVMSNGSSLENVSLNKIGRFKEMVPIGAVFLDKRYMMSFTGALLPSDELFPADDLLPGSVVNDEGLSLPPGAVVIDFLTQGLAFSTLIDAEMGYMFNANSDIHQISSSVPDVFNLVTEDGLNNIVTESGRFNITAQIVTSRTVAKTIRGTELRELNYLSPLFTEGSIGMYKQYEKVRVTFSGNLTILITNDNNDVLATQEMTSVKRHSEWVGIPVRLNGGYGIQFRIVGKCIVDSIMYNWTPKEAQ